MKYTLILIIYFTLGYDSFGNTHGLITKYSQVNEIENSDSIQFKGLKISYCGAESIFHHPTNNSQKKFRQVRN